ncbi:MAG TPA: RodZ domain-containing protein [Gallionella sp.]|nr:RodZ domain-containing protein [Gallionella sp.]
MMKELLDSNAGQGDRLATASTISVGKTLREARERLGLSIADVSSQTKIPARQIEAIESDDFQHLPEMTFVRGFVRCYAKLVQVDTQPLLAALPQPAAGPAKLKPASVEVPFPREHSQQLQRLIRLAVILVVAVPAILYAVWHYTAPPAQPETAQVETPVTLPAEMQAIPVSAAAPATVMAASEVASAVPAASQVPAASMVAPASAVTMTMQLPAVASKPPAPLTQQLAPAAPAMPARSSMQPSPPVPPATKPQAPTEKALTQFVQPALPAAKTAASPVQTQSGAANAGTAGSMNQNAALRLVFDADSWTEIRERGGRIISSQVNPRGSELRLDGRAPFTLVIGHATSARLYYRGKQVDLKPYINAYSEVARVTLE